MAGMDASRLFPDDRSGAAGYSPAAAAADYDRAAVTPGIVHFGTGRRFRTAIAPLVDRILAHGHYEWGIIAVSQTGGPVYDALVANDAAYELAEAHGRVLTRRRIRAIDRILHARNDAAAVIAAIADPRIQLITVAIGPTAYRRSAHGGLDRDDELVRRELAGQQLPVTPVGQIVAGLAARRAAGAPPLTIMACDNLDQNNVILASLIDEMAVAHDVQLADWIATQVRFPAAIGDRLLLDHHAPGGDASVADVVAESYAHWVFEDNLGPERVGLNAIGATFVPEVRPFLKARLRLLDGSLLLLAYVGLLRGHARLDQAVCDPAVIALLDAYLAEVTAVLPPLKGFDSESYAAELKLRYANPAVTLPLARLARNGSVKLPRLIVPTILDSFRLGQRSETCAAIIAAWMLHSTSPDLVDPHSDYCSKAAAMVGDDWERLVSLLCDFEPLFGALGKKSLFRESVMHSVRLLPGLVDLPRG
jgi:mannitol-1-phosphate/altronate dehydrogenase